MRKKLLRIIYEEVDGDIGRTEKMILNRPIFRREYRSSDEIELLPSICEYLIQEGFLSGTVELLSLTGKGLDEVLKRFPSIDPSYHQLQEIQFLVQGLENNDSEIINHLKEIKRWETLLIDLKDKMTLFKTYLDQFYEKTDDTEVKDIFRDVLNSNTFSRFLFSLYRLSNHPKTKNELKKFIKSFGKYSEKIEFKPGKDKSLIKFG